MRRPFTRTLKDAQDSVFANLRKGIKCPCCNKFCKLYKRKLNSGMAVGLIWLVKKAGSTCEWVNVPKKGPRLVISTHPIPTLRHWGLIESKPSKDPKKRCSGWWRPTEKGVLFAHQMISVPRYVFLYNNEIQKFSKEDTDIKRALGDRFNYQELMRGVY